MILLDQAGAGASGARFLSPLCGHERFIEHLWLQRVGPCPAGRTWRLIPDANPYLILVASGEGSRFQMRCNLVGPRSRFADVAMANRIFTCGARLRPGTLPLLTRFPASDFADRAAPVEAVFGTRGERLMERLNESRSPFRALGVIADFLGRAAAGENYAATLPLGACARVEDMAAQVGLPVRTLHSRLMQHVGLSPKRVLRIERLHRALWSSQDRTLAWAQIAADSGFADQAHMIREFVDLLGESPAVWRQRSRLPISSIQRSAPHSIVPPVGWV